ncbi:MAG: AP2 domain-containing protein [Verrucomicrobiota bacterium]
MAKDKKNKGISRIDSGSTHGWFVRGYRNGKTYSKLFSDRKCGGKRKALDMAREYRDQLLEELSKIPSKPRGRRLVYRDARNTTGVLGVCRTSKKSANGTVNDCYSVSWRPEPGVQKCTSFSIRKYGEEKAFQMAVAHRRKMMKEIYGPGVFRKIKKQSDEETPVEETSEA